MNTLFQSQYLKETNHLGDQDVDGDKIKIDDKETVRRCGLSSCDSE
jgi:hypothetical protein